MWSAAKNKVMDICCTTKREIKEKKTESPADKFIPTLFCKWYIAPHSCWHLTSMFSVLHCTGFISLSDVKREIKIKKRNWNESIRIFSFPLVSGSSPPTVWPTATVVQQNILETWSTSARKSIFSSIHFPSSGSSFEYSTNSIWQPHSLHWQTNLIK